MKSTVAFSLDPDQLAMLRAYAKDNGELSTSAALRQILAEWRRMKAANHRLASDACCDEEVRALELAGS